mmetsp:Transcript_27278/g.47074  ORF Transcript_27278/g.47074 Transcript_27278/m.47074 type:complete len:223 (+) Transcript_27278:265-933(+)
MRRAALSIRTWACIDGSHLCVCRQNKTRASTGEEGKTIENIPTQRGCRMCVCVCVSKGRKRNNRLCPSQWWDRRVCVGGQAGLLALVLRVEGLDGLKDRLHGLGEHAHVEHHDTHLDPHLFQEPVLVRDQFQRPLHHFPDGPGVVGGEGLGVGDGGRLAGGVAIAVIGNEAGEEHLEELQQPTQADSAPSARAIAVGLRLDLVAAHTLDGREALSVLGENLS